MNTECDNKDECVACEDDVDNGIGGDNVDENNGVTDKDAIDGNTVSVQLVSHIAMKGRTYKRCQHVNECVQCIKKTQGSSDFCVAHGAFQKKCSGKTDEGYPCPNRALKGGVCIAHGASRKKCSGKTEGGGPCPNGAVKGGVCIAHGASRKKCSGKTEGGGPCPNRA
eukprot:80792-Prymnesium_polylepis.1